MEAGTLYRGSDSQDLVSRSGSQDLEARIWYPGSGSLDLVAKIWKPGSGIVDLIAMIWYPDLADKIW